MTHSSDLIQPRLRHPLPLRYPSSRDNHVCLQSFDALHLAYQIHGDDINPVGEHSLQDISEVNEVNKVKEVKEVLSQQRPSSPIFQGHLRPSSSAPILHTAPRPDRSHNQHYVADKVHVAYTPPILKRTSTAKQRTKRTAQRSGVKQAIRQNIYSMQSQYQRNGAAGRAETYESSALPKRAVSASRRHPASSTVNGRAVRQSRPATASAIRSRNHSGSVELPSGRGGKEDPVEVKARKLGTKDRRLFPDWSLPSNVYKFMRP
jgi:hypothetical protein